MKAFYTSRSMGKKLKGKHKTKTIVSLKENGKEDHIQTNVLIPKSTTWSDRMGPFSETVMEIKIKVSFL